MCALYGLKSAGTSWRSELAQVISDLGYVFTKADADVWIHKAVTDEGHKYYEMLFMYVDDILSASHCMKKMIGEIIEFYRAKEGSIKPPEIYLGANVDKIQLEEDGSEVWATSPRTYIKNSIASGGRKRLFASKPCVLIVFLFVHSSIEGFVHKLWSAQLLIVT